MTPSNSTLIQASLMLNCSCRDSFLSSCNSRYVAANNTGGFGLASKPFYHSEGERGSMRVSPQFPCHTKKNALPMSFITTGSQGSLHGSRGTQCSKTQVVFLRTVVYRISNFFQSDMIIPSSCASIPLVLKLTHGTRWDLCIDLLPFL